MDDRQTLLLGTHGRLGRILSGFAREQGLGWQGQARQEPADVVWSGAFTDPALARALAGGTQTLINMIGITPTTGDAALMDEVNVHLVTDLLDCAAQAGVPHVVLASTAAVYGTSQNPKLRETDILSPTTAYGQSKARMEDAALKWSAQNGGPALSILRLGNVAGADVLLQSAKQHAGHGPMPLHILPDGSAPVRPYIGPRDFFLALRAIANRKISSGQVEVINIAHPTPIGLDALLEAYRDLLLQNLTWKPAPVPDGIIPQVIFDTTKLATIIDLPRVSDQAHETARQVATFQALCTDAPQ